MSLDVAHCMVKITCVCESVCAFVSTYYRGHFLINWYWPQLYHVPDFSPNHRKLLLIALYVIKRCPHLKEFFSMSLTSYTYREWVSVCLVLWLEWNGRSTCNQYSIGTCSCLSWLQLVQEMTAAVRLLVVLRSVWVQLHPAASHVHVLQTAVQRSPLMIVDSAEVCLSYCLPQRSNRVWSFYSWRPDSKLPTRWP